MTAFGRYRASRYLSAFPRGLSAEEAEAWANLAATVVPMAGNKTPPPSGEVAARRADGGGAATANVARRQAPSTPRYASGPPPPMGEASGRPAPGLDSHWERRLGAGTLQPDFTLDLHGLGLDAAHGRLMGGVAQARAMGARVVLLIAGKPRPAEAADRGAQRGAIRAKVLDWLAASSHSRAIAAIRKAHRRHGGEGALYIVLRKER